MIHNIRLNSKLYFFGGGEGGEGIFGRHLSWAFMLSGNLVNISVILGK